MRAMLTVALRNVLRNRRRTLITLAALVVGVGVMVTMRGLLNGLQRSLVTNVSQSVTGAVQVHKKGYLANVLASPLTLDLPVPEVLATVQKEPLVTAAAPRIAFAAMVSFADETVFSPVLAVDPSAEPRVCPLRERGFSPAGAYPGRGDPEAVMVASSIVSSTGVEMGAQGALLSNDRDGVLSGENIRLAGTVDLALPGDKRVIVAPLALAQKLLKMDGRATEIAVQVEPIEAADLAAERLRAALGPSYEVHTWAEVAMFVRQAMERQNFIISLVAFAFLFLMLLGVANTTLMSVLERTREIGTMMALGVRRGRILTLFLVEALVIGGAGASLGGVLGWAVTMHLGRRGLEFALPGAGAPFQLYPFVELGYLAGMVGLATAGAAIFSLYPALRASRLRPVQALSGQ